MQRHMEIGIIAKMLCRCHEQRRESPIWSKPLTRRVQLRSSSFARPRALWISGISWLWSWVIAYEALGLLRGFSCRRFLRLELGDLDDYLDLVGLRHRHHAGRTICDGGLRVSQHGGIPSGLEARRTVQPIRGQITSGAALLS